MVRHLSHLVKGTVAGSVPAPPTVSARIPGTLPGRSRGPNPPWVRKHEPTQEYEFRLILPSSVQLRLFTQVLYVTRSSGQFGATNGYAFDIVR